MAINTTEATVHIVADFFHNAVFCKLSPQADEDYERWWKRSIRQVGDLSGPDLVLLYLTSLGLEDSARNITLIDSTSRNGSHLHRYAVELLDAVPDVQPAGPTICPDCKGSGKYIGFLTIEPCERCGGEGTI